MKASIKVVPGKGSAYPTFTIKFEGLTKGSLMALQNSLELNKELANSAVASDMLDFLIDAGIESHTGFPVGGIKDSVERNKAIEEKNQATMDKYSVSDYDLIRALRKFLAGGFENQYSVACSIISLLEQNESKVLCGENIKKLAKAVVEASAGVDDALVLCDEILKGDK